MIIDTHAHLYYDNFKEDFDSVIQRTKDAGVEYIINIGADLESSQKALQQTQGKPIASGISFYSSVGLHPHEASKLTTDESIHEAVNKLEELCQSDTQKIVAIGECGLDFHFEGNFNDSPSPLSKENLILIQKRLFIEQIKLAKKLNLPLIIHSRDSWQDIFLPELSGTRGVFHSFTGNSETAQKALDLGYYLSFSCIITYPKNEALREVVKNIPLDKILTETDCPFLPPQTQRGQRNEPANVAQVVKTITEIKGLSFESVAEATSHNAQTLFHLS